MKIRRSLIFVCAVMVAGSGVALAAGKSPSKGKSSPAQPGSSKAKPATDSDDPAETNRSAEAPEDLEVATFGSGCFWCAEAVFERLKGVKAVVSGYSGGHVENPTYRQVSSGMTGHAEVVQITFDPSVISYEELLDVFWKTHDPTKLNQQGPDHGPQYRSVIFYHNERQKELAEKSKSEQANPGHSSRRGAKEAKDTGASKPKGGKPTPGSRKIVTAIEPFTEFYAAEPEHQNYFRNHPNEAYCQAEVRPRVNKANRLFRDKLKTRFEDEAE